MRKREFLNQLRRRLNEEKCNDVDDIISYYDELIEDTIDRTGEYEETVIKELGSIEDIVIRVNPNSSKKSNKDKIYYDELEPESSNESKKKSSKKISKNNQKDDDLAIKIIIAIVTAPLWISAIVVLGVLIFAAAMAGVGIGIAGVVCVVQGVFDIAASLGNALFQMGVGCILCGVATIGAPLIIKIISILIKAIIGFVKWLFGAFNNGGRRKAYEN